MKDNHDYKQHLEQFCCVIGFLCFLQNFITEGIELLMRTLRHKKTWWWVLVKIFGSDYGLPLKYSNSSDTFFFFFYYEHFNFFSILSHNFFRLMLSIFILIVIMTLISIIVFLFSSLFVCSFVLQRISQCKGNFFKMLLLLLFRLSKQTKKKKLKSNCISFT